MKLELFDSDCYQDELLYYPHPNFLDDHIGVDMAYRWADMDHEHLYWLCIGAIGRFVYSDSARGVYELLKTWEI
jgi:hypothetical protein